MYNIIQKSIARQVVGFITLFSICTSLFAGFGGANIAQASGTYADPDCTSATLNGEVFVNGAETIVWFEWGEGNSLNRKTREQFFDHDSHVSQRITGLREDTMYSFRGIAENPYGRAVGDTLTFRTKKCTPDPEPRCEDRDAINYGGKLPCKYPQPEPKCEDHDAINYGGKLPCKYPKSTVSLSIDSKTFCVYRDGSQDNDRPFYTVQASQNLANAKVVWSSTQNGKPTGEENASYQHRLDSNAFWDGYGHPWRIQDIGRWTKTASITKDFNSISAVSNKVSFEVKDCTPKPQKCEDPDAINYGGPLPCKYAPKKCTDPDAINYGGPLPCKYPKPKCEDRDAINYGGSLPCKYPPQKCEDRHAENYGGPLPCKYKQIVKKPFVKLTADKYNLLSGESTTIHWEVKNADSCTATGDWSGMKNTHGGFSGTGILTSSKTYNIRCENKTDSASDSLTIVVSPQAQKPTVILRSDAENNEVPFNTKTKIHWDVQNADSCRASGDWSGSKSTNGGSTTTGNLTRAKTYELTCTNNAGSTTATLTIDVREEGGPTVRIFADTENELPFNTGTNIHWNSTNAQSCKMTGGSGAWKNEDELSGIFPTGKLREDTTYNITCKNSAGKSASASVTVNVADENIANPTVDLSIDDENLVAGEDTNVRWEARNVNVCRTTGGTNGWTSSTKAFAGVFPTGAITKTTTFSITCENRAGKAVSASVRASVGGPTVEIRATDPELDTGESTNIHWTSENATRCTADAGSRGWAGRKSFSGVFNTGKLERDTTFNITCENERGVSDSASVTVIVHGKEPIVRIWADKERVPFGKETTLRWESEDADTCEGVAGTSNWIGNKKLRGFGKTGMLEEETTFIISCINEFGSRDASVTIKVAPKIVITTL